MKLFDIFKTSRTREILELKREINQNWLNRSLYQPYASGLPFVMNDNMKEYVKDGYMKNSPLYSIINIITRSLAAIPFNVYVVKDKKAFTYYKNYSGRKRVTDVVQSSGLKKKSLELAEQSDMQGVLERPNPMQGQSEFIENLQGFKEITGNSYIHGVEVDNAFGELWVMPAHLVEIISSGGVESIIRGYRITDYVYDIELPVETVMHLKYWNPDYSSTGSHLYGMSPIRAARSVVQQSNDNFTAMSRALQNMGAEGMLSLEDDMLTDKQIDAMRQDLKDRGEGVDNLKKILVSTAKWKWVKFGLSPVDLNIIQSMREAKRELCDIYGLSSELLNDPENKTQANKKEARKGLYHEVILPKADSLRDELNRWLAPNYSKRDGVEYYIDYDVSAIDALSEDLQQQIGALMQAPISYNEIREAIGYESHPSPYMNVPMVPLNKVPIDDFSTDFDEDLKLYANGRTKASLAKNRA